MRRPVKWALVAVGVVVALVVIALAIGALTPRTHRAAVRVTYRAAPEIVYARIHDVAAAAEWRTGLQRVEVLSSPTEPTRWREVSDWGTLTFVHDAAEPPRRIVARIVDEGQGFGGTWTYELTPDGDGTALVITEDGVIDKPLYRFMSKYLMGYYEGLETYARDLGRRLGEQVEPMRAG